MIISTEPFYGLNQMDGERLTVDQARSRLQTPPYINPIVANMKNRKGHWYCGSLVHQQKTRAELLFYDWLAQNWIDTERVGISDDMIAFHSYGGSSAWEYESYTRYLSDHRRDFDYTKGEYWMSEDGFYRELEHTEDDTVCMVPILPNTIVSFDTLTSIGWALWRVTRDFKGQVSFFKDHMSFACTLEGDAVILAQFCEMLGVLRDEPSKTHHELDDFTNELAG